MGGWLIGLFAVVAGALNTVQAGANATLSKSLAQPLAAALVVSGVNAIVYLAAALAIGASPPEASRIAATPWWAWCGGVLGGIYVLAMVFYAERLGSALFTGLTVTAAIATSVVLDHFGLVGFKQHAAGLWRILGCVLMIGGLALITIF